MHAWDAIRGMCRAPYFVAALACEDSLHALVAHGFREEELGRAVEVEHRVLDVVDGRVEVLCQRHRRRFDDVEVGVGVLSHGPGGLGFVEAGLVGEADGEGLDGGGLEVGGDAEDGARVEATGQIHADAHVCDEALLHGVHEAPAGLLHHALLLLTLHVGLNLLQLLSVFAVVEVVVALEAHTAGCTPHKQGWGEMSEERAEALSLRLV